MLALQEQKPAMTARRWAAGPLPDRRTIVQFLYPELPVSKRDWWLVIEPEGKVDLCWSDPGFDVDLHVSTDLRTMTSVWMGIATVNSVRDKITFTGSRVITGTMQTWLVLGLFAVERKRVP